MLNRRLQLLKSVTKIKRRGRRGRREGSMEEGVKELFIDFLETGEQLKRSSSSIPLVDGKVKFKFGAILPHWI